MKLPGRFLEKDENLIVLMGLIGGVALVLTLLAVYSYAVPEAESKIETLASYEHTGRYTYSVTTEPSAINPSETIGPVLPEDLADSGEPPPPIFTRLAHGLEFVYAYQIQGASNVSGTISAELEIKAGTSWSERLPLAGPSEFKGATGGVEGTIDFTQVAALLQQVEEQTGVTSGSVDLTIIPTVDVQGTANGQQFDEIYSSPLTFVYTSNLITPGETLSFNEPKTVTATVRRDNEINLFGGSVLVSTVREIAAPLAVATLALSGVFAAIFFLGVGRSEVATVRSRYRGLMVPVAEVESAVSHRISVASLLDLAQLAKRENRSLFVRDFDNGSQAYLMHDGMVVYQYTIGDVPAGWIRAPGSTMAVAEEPVVETAVTQELRREEPIAPVAIEEEVVTVVETIEEPVEAIEEPEAPVEVVEAVAVSEEAVEEPMAPAAVAEEVVSIAEAIKEPLTLESAAEEEVEAVAEVTEEPAATDGAVEEEVAAIAEVIEEPPTIEATVEDDTQAVAEVVEETATPDFAVEEKAATVEVVEEPMVRGTDVEEEIRAMADAETVEAGVELTSPVAEEPALPAEVVDVEETVAELETPAATEEEKEEAPSAEEPVPVVTAEEESVEVDSTDTDFAPIPQWLTASYEYEDDDVAETERVEEEPVSSEPNGLEHAPEETLETMSVSPWAAPHANLSAAAAHEGEETAATAEEPVDSAWSRPLETLAEVTDESAATRVDAEALDEASSLAEEATEQPGSVAESVSSMSHTRGHSPRPAVRRWLRNRSGGPLLDSTHNHRPATAHDEPTSGPESAERVAGVAEGNGNGHHEEAVTELSVTSQDTESQPIETEPTAAIENGESNVSYDEPLADVEFARSPEEMAYGSDESPDVVPTDSPAPPAVDIEPEQDQSELVNVVVSASAASSEESSPAPQQARPQATLDRKLVRYARRWLRDVLADESDKQ